MGINKMIRRCHYLIPDKNRLLRCCREFSTSDGKQVEEGMFLVKAGLPMFLFCGLGVWVVSNGIQGKNAERDAFQGRISKCVKTICEREKSEKRNDNALE